MFLVGLTGAALARGAERPWKTAIGLNGFGSSERVFKKRYELEDILKMAREDGFEGIELWHSFHGSYPDPSDDAAIAALRRQIESYNIRVFSIQSLTRGSNPVDPDPEARNKYTAVLRGQVDLARKLGCECIGIWPPPVPAARGAGEDETIERFAESLRPALRYAVDRGLLPAVEGEPPLIINSPARYHKLFAAVGMREFKVIFDPSHFDLLTGGKLRPDLLLKELGVERVGYVQFTDGDGTPMVRPDGSTGTSKHLPVGEGKYDIAGLLDVLYRGGFRGWFQIDTWETADPFHASRAGKKAVDAFLLKVRG
jgi:sugar phosphate isomerase/epimerase